MATPAQRSFILATLLVACSQGLEDPPVDSLRHPTGLAISPDGGWLLVTGGNLDHRHTGGAVWALDLDRLADALEDEPRPAGAAVSTDRPCRRMAEGLPYVECDDSVFISGEDTVFVSTGAGNVGLDRPKGAMGPVRLLIPVRDPAAITWIDATFDGGGVQLECGQGERRTCDTAHQITELSSDAGTKLPADPANLLVDQEARYAYVPHLIGGRISLLALDGQAGPELTDVESDFFREDPFEEIEIAGGFAVARRICDPDDPILGSRGCERPYLFSSQRYWPGTREFTVAPGLDVIQGRTETALLAFDAEQVELRPYMGDLEFQDPATGDDLLIVHNTPPGLSRVDTSLDENAQPTSELRDTVSLCRNPNMLEVVRRDGAETLAFVSCFGEDEVAVVGLGAFTVIANIGVGEGPNELVYDAGRDWVYVANTREDTLSVIETDATSPAYLTEIARVGLGGQVPS